MSTRTMHDVIGHDVVALDNAETIGKVKHFVLAPDASRIERLHIDGRGAKSLFTDWNDLESFGTDRVVVKHADAIARSADDHDLESARGHIDILGARLLDTAGFERGTVTDVTFDADSGRLVSLTSSDDIEIDAEQLHSVGTYAAVVDP